MQPNQSDDPIHSNTWFDEYVQMPDTFVNREAEPTPASTLPRGDNMPSINNVPGLERQPAGESSSGLNHVPCNEILVSLNNIVTAVNTLGVPTSIVPVATLRRDGSLPIDSWHKI